MRASVKTVTPVLAEKWLRKNPKNRRVNGSSVDRIASDIRGGRWVENGQTITFDVNGNLVDGQHRLHAVAKSGKSVRSVVVTGVSPEAMPTIDCGEPRRFADVCEINGEPNARHLAATAKIAWRHRQGMTLRSLAPSNSELEAFLDDHPELRDSLPYGRACVEILTQSVGAFCHWVFSADDRDKASAFFHGLATGANLGPRSPILHLRNRLQGAKASRHALLTTPSKIWLTFRAWIAFRDGKQMQRLQLPRDGSLVLPSLNQHPQ